MGLDGPPCLLDMFLSPVRNPVGILGDPVLKLRLDVHTQPVQEFNVSRRLNGRHREQHLRHGVLTVLFGQGVQQPGKLLGVVDDLGGEEVGTAVDLAEQAVGLAITRRDADIADLQGRIIQGLANKLVRLGHVGPRILNAAVLPPDEDELANAVLLPRLTEPVRLLVRRQVHHHAINHALETEAILDAPCELTRLDPGLEGLEALALVALGALFANLRDVDALQRNLAVDPVDLVQDLLDTVLALLDQRRYGFQAQTKGGLFSAHREMVLRLRQRYRSLRCPAPSVNRARANSHQ
jgi:hypothetical protein